MSVNSITRWNLSIKYIVYLNALAIFLDSAISLYAIKFLGCQEMNENVIFFMDIFGITLSFIILDIALYFILYIGYKKYLKIIKIYTHLWLYLIFLFGLSIIASRRLLVVYANLLEIRPLL